MQETANITKAADSLSLITLYEARIGLNFVVSSDESLDEMIEMLVSWSSDEIAVTCQRTLARETLIETYREINECNRIWLSHFPVVEITSINENGTILGSSDYELDSDSGKVYRLGQNWIEPVTFQYTGGYDLPYGSPPALRQATMLMVREAYYAIIRGDASVRMLGHKESRVIYFDPRLAAIAGAKGGGTAGSAARRAVANLLTAYTRYAM